MYKVQVTPLIGLPRFDGWAHVTTIANDRVVWALSVSGQHARNIGRDLLDLITATPEILDGAALYELATQLVEEANNKEGQLSLACGWLNNQGKSVFCAYQGSIVLKRSGKSGQLLQAGGQLKIIEGSITPEDIYIFATAQAAQFLGEIQQKLEQGYEIDTIVTSITPGLHLEETTALSAMAFVKQEPFVATVVAEQQQEKKEEVNLAIDQVVLQPKVMESKIEYQPEPTVPMGNIDLPDTQPVAKATHSVDWKMILYKTQPIIIKIAAVTKSVGAHLANLPAVLPGMLAKYRPDQKMIENTQQPSLFSDVAEEVPQPITAVELGLPSFLNQSQSTANFTHYGQEVYVGAAARRQSVRTILLLLVVILVIFGVVGYFFFQRQQQVSAATLALQPFEQQLEQARTTVDQDPITARNNVQQAIAGIETLQVSFRDKAASLAKIDTALKEAKQFYDEVSGREEFSELPVFFNSRNDSLDIVITHAGVFKESMLFFDAQKKQGALVKVSDASATAFSLELEKEVTDLAASTIDDTVWLLTDAVYQYKAGSTNAKPEEKLAPSDRLSSSSLVSIFGNAVYTFNPTERSILKYTQEDDTFTGPVKWLKSAQGLDFEQVVSMVVDGDIWLTDKKGSIFRLRAGNSQDFSVKGLEQAFNSSLILFTTEESEKLYLLEPANHRVVVLTKDGEFIREVTSSSLAAASQIIVNVEETKLFAINGSTVYEVAL